MARHSYYTQIKSSLLYSDRALDWIIFASFIWAATAFFNYHTDTFVFIPFFMFVLYNIFLYKPTIKDWDMGGFKKLTVDMAKNTIVLDDKITVRASNIDSILIDIDERPRMIWLLGFTGKYKKLVNGEIIFRLNDGKNKTIPIQYKTKLIDFVRLMQQMNIPCKIRNKQFLEEGTPPIFWWSIIFIVVLSGGAYLVINFFIKLSQTSQIY